MNNGFDNDQGYYKVVVGDHLNYRFEVLQDLDKGAFGQVVRCLDHKENVEVAIKINRNSTWDHSSSRTEITILRKLRAG
jgi:dual specificity tyrosine-phosphorylation-regulated kinase 2/3/4